MAGLPEQARRVRVSLLLLLSLLAAGCGEPLVVLGDAPGYLRVVAGIGDSLGTRVDSLATRSRLTDPTGVVFDHDTNVLYIADRGATRQSGGITTRVTRVFSVASTGRLRLLLDASACSGGTCVIETTAMTLAPDGAVLIADGVGNRVFRFMPATLALTVVAGTGANVFAPDGTLAAQASLRRPAGIAAGADGSIYIAEEDAHRVRRIDPAGVLRTVAGNGVAAHAGDGDLALNAAVHSPAGLSLHGDQLYVAESGAHTVRRVDLGSGIIETVAGNGAKGFAGDGGAAEQASLATPRAVLVSENGAALYISDRDNHRVRLVNLASNLITTYAGNGSSAFTGSRQPAGTAGVRTPSGLAAGGGFLFIADAGLHVVWRAVISL